MSRNCRRTRRWYLARGRALHVDLLEGRSLLAAGTLAGSAWEEVWSGLTSTAGVAQEFQQSIAGDFNCDSFLDLLVHPSVGSNRLFLGTGDGTFAEDIEAGSFPAGLAADIDNDGDQDLLSAVEGRLTVQVNSGHIDGVWGGFQAETSIPLDAGEPAVLDMLSDDWNGDGHSDLAVTRVGVQMRLGTAGGLNGLGPPIFYPLIATESRRLVSGDFDLDGDLDLVSAATNYNGSSLDVLHNDGTGTFEPATSETSLPRTIGDLVAGDIDGDGDLDLAVAYGDYFYTPNLAIIRNEGAATFEQYPTPLAVSGGPRGLALGDVDADGHLDLAVSHGSVPHCGVCYPGVVLFLGNGEGGFGELLKLQSTDVVTMLVESSDHSVGDEIVVFNRSGALNVLRHVRPKLLQPELETEYSQIETFAWLYNSVVVGDWNSDGLTDIVADRAGQLSLGIAQADRSYQWLSLPQYDDVYLWMMADLTGDGLTDLGLFVDTSFVVLPQDANEQLGFAVATPVSGHTWTGELSDLDANGLPDLMLKNTIGAYRVLFGRGGGTFELGPTIVQGNDIRLADLNNDARIDLTIITDRELLTYLGDPVSGFFQASSLPIQSESRFHRWEDFTGDGLLDLILLSSRNVRVLMGRSDGTFLEAAGSPLRATNLTVNMADRDLNRDGRNDLVLITEIPGTLSAWLVQPEDQLAAPFHLDIPAYSYARIEQDFNGDQIVDFVLSSDVKTSVLLGSSDGTFQLAFEPLSGRASYVSVSEDLNADGRLDLAIQFPWGLRLWTVNNDGAFADYFYLPILDPNSYMRRSQDLNGDGRADYLLISANQGRLLLSGAEPPYAEVFAFPPGFSEFEFGEITGDGLADALTWGWSRPVTIWTNNGDWTFTQSTLDTSMMTSAVLTDIDDDGWLDIVGIGPLLTGWLNDHGEALIEYFSVAQYQYQSGNAANDLVKTADLNRDGHLDVVLGWTDVFSSLRVTVLLSDPSGALGLPIIYTFPRMFTLHRIVLGDIDQDGDLDVQLDGDMSWYPAASPLTHHGVILNQANLLWPVGDANRDGQFDSADLVQTFQAGEYEDTLTGNSNWTEGDWNGDGEFTTSDLVLAFQSGTYVAAVELPTASARADIERQTIR